MTGGNPIESHDDPRLEALLRSALESRADAVHPAERFPEIREDSLEPQNRPHRWSRRPVAMALAAALVVGFLISFLAPVTSDGSQAPVSASPGPAAGGMASAQSSVATVQTGIEVFYVGRTDGLLYREKRDLPTLGDRLGTAVAAVLNVAPLDPEYKSNWSGGQVNSATVKGDRITLDLSESAFAQFETRNQEEQAIQQLVYAATAAVGGSGSKSVQILVDGAPNLPLIGKPETPFTRGGVSLAPIWVDSPQFGQTVRSGDVTISGSAQRTVTSMAWALYKGDAKRPRATGTVAMGRGTGDWAQWATRITVPKGRGEWQVVVSAGATRITRTIEVE